MNESSPEASPFPVPSKKSASLKMRILVLITLVVLAIIIVILLSGSLAEAPTDGVGASPPAEQRETNEPPVSESDDVDSIAQDLEDSQTDNLDTELNAIEGEL